MFFKKLEKSFKLLLLTIFIIPINVFAYSDYVIPGGENIGITLSSNGIIIVGTYEVNGENPAEKAGLKVGDIISNINDQKTTTIDEMVSLINSSNLEDTITVTYVRNNKTQKTDLKLYQDQNKVYKTGLYVKDTVTGIGTLTFIDPKTKIFGALGHEIIEKTTGQILEIKDGKIYDSTVTGINPSDSGIPGEKNARIDTNNVNGIIFENTNKGIFGNYQEKLPDKKLYKVADYEEIKTGNANIYTVVNGTEIEEYSINIIKLSNSIEKTKNILFEITDKELLDKTNGIVQGMSGSPIIQGDYIIGAVTHVVVDNPNKGYGIFITNMLEEAEN